MALLRVKNWAEFQHYKDRDPPWIKLHHTLLDNRDFHRLSPLAGKLLPLIWLVASEKGGALIDADELAFRLRVSEEQCNAVLKELETAAFIVSDAVADDAPQPSIGKQRAEMNGFGSRHIPDKVKRAVWERDEGKCVFCGSDENIEYDHIRPVSKGGTAEEGNVQLLCRPCNRKKRTSMPAEQSATPAQPTTGPTYTEAEAQDQQETDSGVVAPAPVAIAPEVEIIQAFDAERVKAFGTKQARLYPHNTDHVFAKRFLADGATPDFCRGVFAAGFQRSASRKTGPPDTLSFFEKPIANAIAEQNRPPTVGQPNERPRAKYSTDTRDIQGPLVRAAMARDLSRGDAAASEPPGSEPSVASG